MPTEDTQPSSASKKAQELLQKKAAEKLEKQKEDERNQKEVEQEATNVYQTLVSKIAIAENNIKELEASLSLVKSKRLTNIVDQKTTMKDLSSTEDGKEILLDKESKDQIFTDPTLELEDLRKQQKDIKEQIKKYEEELDSLNNEAREAHEKTPEYKVLLEQQKQAAEAEIDQKIIGTHSPASIEIDRYTNQKGEISFNPNIKPETVKLQEELGKERVEEVIIDMYVAKVTEHYDKERNHKINPSFKEAINNAREFPKNISEAFSAVRNFENKLLQAGQKLATLLDQKPYLKTQISFYGASIKDYDIFFPSYRFSKETIKSWDQNFSSFLSSDIAINKEVYNPMAVMSVIESNSIFIDTLLAKFETITDETEARNFFKNSEYKNLYSSFGISELDNAINKHPIFSRDEAKFITENKGIDGAQKVIDVIEKDIAEREKVATELVKDKVKVAFIDEYTGIEYKKGISALNYEAESHEKMQKRIEDALIEVASLESRVADRLNETLTLENGNALLSEKKKIYDKLKVEEATLEKERIEIKQNIEKHTTAGRPKWIGQSAYDTKLTQLNSDLNEATTKITNKAQERNTAGYSSNLYFNDTGKIFEKLGDSIYSHGNSEEFHRLHPEFYNGTTTIRELVEGIKKYLSEKKDKPQDAKILEYVKTYRGLLKKLEEERQEFKNLSNKK